MTSRSHLTALTAGGQRLPQSAANPALCVVGKSGTLRKSGYPSHTMLQVLNGAIAAALFNLLYDLVLSQKVKWYAMCPVVDFLNHKSTVQVQHLVLPPPFRKD